MCGIAGYQGQYPEWTIRKMLSYIAHRGPDGEGIWSSTDQTLALGHRRLAIIDLSEHASQPMFNEDGTVVLVVNGEIYNHLALREDLIKRGHTFQSQCDSEILLHLYEEYGVDMVTYLNGIFAFAIWDIGRRHLFCARDPLGVKPFYYSAYKDRFIFASELKALLADQELPKEINYKTIYHHLTYLWSPAPDTMFKYVSKLEPGHALLVKESKIDRKWQYYDLPITKSDPTKISEAEWGTYLIEKLQCAVRRQMMSDVPVGAFLSGGLDSTAIVTFMRQYSDTPIQCYTISASNSANYEGFSNDLPYARKAAHHLGVPLEEVEVTPDIVSTISESIYTLDEPLADPSAINVSLISKKAADQGVKVLLSGVGGDDILSGYRRHLAIASEKYWGWLPYHLRAKVAQGSRRLSVNAPLIRRLKKLLQYIDLEENQRLISYFDWWNPKDRRRTICHEPDYDAYTPMHNHLTKVGIQDPLKAMLYLEVKGFLSDHNLIYTDKMSMVHGIEVRVPFLDLDFVQFSTTIPSNYKQRGMVGKYIFKRAMEPFLPQTIIYRPKTGFGAPIRKWVTDDLREMIGDVLSENRIKKRGWFDPHAVQELLQQNETQAVDGTYIIWALMSIEIWATRFLDGSSI